MVVARHLLAPGRRRPITPVPVKTARCDADDREGVAIEQDRGANHPRVGAEAVLPDRMAQNHRREASRTGNGCRKNISAPISAPILRAKAYQSGWRPC